MNWILLCTRPASSAMGGGSSVEFSDSLWALEVTELYGESRLHWPFFYIGNLRHQDIFLVP